MTPFSGLSSVLTATGNSMSMVMSSITGPIERLTSEAMQSTTKLIDSAASGLSNIASDISTPAGADFDKNFFMSEFIPALAAAIGGSVKMPQPITLPENRNKTIGYAV
jgi:hypothetical protein